MGRKVWGGSKEAAGGTEGGALEARCEGGIEVGGRGGSASAFVKEGAAVAMGATAGGVMSTTTVAHAGDWLAPVQGRSGGSAGRMLRSAMASRAKVLEMVAGDAGMRDSELGAPPGVGTAEGSHEVGVTVEKGAKEGKVMDGVIGFDGGSHCRFVWSRGGGGFSGELGCWRWVNDG